MQNQKPAQSGLGLQKTKGLKPQTLEKGTCGIFLWENTVPKTFVFFQKENSPIAKYYEQGTEINLEAVAPMESFADADGLELHFRRNDGEQILLKGGFTDTLEGGRRITGATIKVIKPGGWEEIHPVSGVYSCVN